MSVIVVSSAMSNINSSVFNVINKAVFLVNLSAVLTLQVTFKRFRLADTFETAIALIFRLYQFVRAAFSFSEFLYGLHNIGLVFWRIERV